MPAAVIPSTITPAILGQRTFHEDFANFDAGPDQKAPGKHRWRTILKGWDATKAPDPMGRQITGDSFASDATLGADLNPFLYTRAMTLLCKQVPPARQAEFGGKHYAGVQITTKFSFSQLFGYFEIQCTLPAGRGPFPSFWMLPVTGAWPANGEIDVFEVTGDPTHLYSTVHTGVKGYAGPAQKKVALGFDGSAAPHLYGVAWNADELVWFVDRKEVFRAPTPADMRTVPMFLLVQLGCSHPWDNNRPDANTRFPIKMPVYQVNAWNLRT